MSLRKPKSVPKIPKVRQKSIDKVIETTPMEKQSEIEFNCRIFFNYNKKFRKQEYVIELNTVKEFSSLNYSLTIDARKASNNIDIRILGLKADATYASKPGPASKQIVFEELYGEHTINIIKQDGSINSAAMNFNVFKKEVKLLNEFLPEKKNNRKFCTFEVADDLFTFPEKGLI